jgi:hypothetical protein
VASNVYGSSNATIFLKPKSLLLWIIKIKNIFWFLKIKFNI